MTRTEHIAALRELLARLEAEEAAERGNSRSCEDKQGGR